MSPRLASAITSRPASRAAASTRSRAARPAEPNRSKKATCGFTTGTVPAKASMQRRPNSRRPVGLSGSPQAVEQRRRRVDAGAHGPVARPPPRRTTGAGPDRPAVAAATTRGDGTPASTMGGADQLVERRDPVSPAPGPRTRRAPGGRPWIAEGGRADLHGIRTGEQQLHRVPARRTPPTPMMAAPGWRARQSNTARTATGCRAAPESPHRRPAEHRSPRRRRRWPYPRGCSPG